MLDGGGILILGVATEVLWLYTEQLCYFQTSSQHWTLPGSHFALQMCHQV